MGWQASYLILYLEEHQNSKAHPSKWVGEGILSKLSSNISLFRRKRRQPELKIKRSFLNKEYCEENLGEASASKPNLLIRVSFSRILGGIDF
jgi:hypothetical protein